MGMAVEEIGPRWRGGSTSVPVCSAGAVVRLSVSNQMNSVACLHLVHCTFSV